jgi:hypothetical protein
LGNATSNPNSPWLWRLLIEKKGAVGIQRAQGEKQARAHYFYTPFAFYLKKTS